MAVYSASSASGRSHEATAFSATSTRRSGFLTLSDTLARLKEDDMACSRRATMVWYEATPAAPRAATDTAASTQANLRVRRATRSRAFRLVDRNCFRVVEGPEHLASHACACASRAPC